MGGSEAVGTSRCMECGLPRPDRLPGIKSVHGASSPLLFCRARWDPYPESPGEGAGGGSVAAVAASSTEARRGAPRPSIGWCHPVEAHQGAHCSPPFRL
jgi:hypothetical protein